jgi:hypothetical protein
LFIDDRLQSDRPPNSAGGRGRPKLSRAPTGWSKREEPATQLCVARHTERLQQVVRFYRDGIGLTEIGGFRDHDGYNGVLLAVPGTGAHAPGADRRRRSRRSSTAS